jgi:hypothetical protein
MLDRLATLAEVGKRGGVPRRAGHGGGAGRERPCPPVASRERPYMPVERQRSTSHRHRVGGTSSGSCWSWTAGAPAPKQLRRGRRRSFLPPRPARRSRDAAGTNPKAPDPTSAAPAALGHQPAAAPAAQPGRPAHARRPAAALLTPSTAPTASPARPHPSSRPRRRPRPKEVPCRPKVRPARAQPGRSPGTAGWCCSDAAARGARRPQPSRSLLLSR